MEKLTNPQKKGAQKKYVVTDDQLVNYAACCIKYGQNMDSNFDPKTQKRSEKMDKADKKIRAKPLDEHAIQQFCQDYPCGATLGVGDGAGKLFVHGNYEAIKRVQTMIFELEKLRKREL